jgi:predicted nuclease of predicted toxin-antitoxin system
MKFFFDECLDPALTQIAMEAGYEASCSRDRSMLSVKDWDLAQYVAAPDDILVTHNSKNFRGKTASGIPLAVKVRLIWLYVGR